MDKTLKDYINRVQDRLKEEKQSSNDNQYQLYPPKEEEKDSTQNPYGQH